MRFHCGWSVCLCIVSLSPGSRRLKGPGVTGEPLKVQVKVPRLLFHYLSLFLEKRQRSSYKTKAFSSQPWCLQAGHLLLFSFPRRGSIRSARSVPVERRECWKSRCNSLPPLLSPKSGAVAAREASAVLQPGLWAGGGEGGWLDVLFNSAVTSLR